MKWYKRHLGDYARDTRTLSTYQHGVYNLLLDWYYSHETPIPVDLIHRIVQARSGPEKRATDEVVAAYFDTASMPGFALNKRATFDISIYKDKAAINSLIAKERESTKRARKEHETCTRTAPSQKPVTNKQQEQKQKQPQAALIEVPDWIDAEAWAGFVAMRIKERHPLTPRAASLILKRLDEFRQAGHNPNKILDASTAEGWRNVYPPKPMNGNGNGKSTLASRLAAEARAIAADEAGTSRDDAKGLAMDGRLLRPQVDFIDG